jgi:hypothetical protein
MCHSQLKNYAHTHRASTRTPSCGVQTTGAWPLPLRKKRHRSKAREIDLGPKTMAVPDESSASGRADRLVLKKSAWTTSEDAVLKEQVRLNGPRNWENISAALPGRNAKSCRLRWCQHLSPEVDADRPFTPQEDAAIVALQQEHPNKWVTISGFLQGRTDNAVKNRWNSVLRKQQEQGVRTARRVAVPVMYDHAPVAEDDGACLQLFPLVPGDIVRGNARGAAPMDVNCGADDPLTELRLFPSSPAKRTRVV